MNFSKSFLNFVGRLSVAGIIILGGFHFGYVFYISEINTESDKVAVRSLSEEIKSPSNDGLTIRVQEYKKTVSPEILKSWLEPYVRNYTGKEDVRISPEEVQEYLASIAPLINIQPVNAKFTLVNGKAEEFVPSEYGLNLDMEVSKKLIVDAVVNGVQEVNLPVELIEPAITLDRVNELGITTLIGRGESDFGGSPSSRIHNIKVGSARYTGTIVKLDEEFSFNSMLGEVDERGGYQPELVIKGGKLIYEYGGGLCQVSTTLFRSAIMAGLPILERRPHSFPVRYYDPQGYDATIYPGVVDLKFKNDTSNHILIQSRIEGTKLIFDIYGPDDDRKVALDGPFQYDQKANGSMKAYFVRKITHADGTTEEKRFDSKYGAPAPRERNPLE
ncbi:MAG: VanW family protein [Candidatus Yanofskybacteria bacterium]|nr:VanW family protein [Candidatus Yanofskybacteria bacterium]